MTTPTPEQAARQRAGIVDYTCGVCGEEFGSNCSPGDIECTNNDCEARRCPACEAWFTENGDSSLDLREIPALRAEVAQLRAANFTATEALRDIMLGGVVRGGTLCAIKDPSVYAGNALSKIAELKATAPAEPKAAPSIADGLVRNIDDLHDLIRDMFGEYATELLDYADRAGQLGVHDTDGLPLSSGIEDGDPFDVPIVRSGKQDVGQPVPEARSRPLRLKGCVEAWPECSTGEYNPSCCRFPKSCSCDVYDAGQVAPEILETPPDAAEPPPARGLDDLFAEALGSFLREPESAAELPYLDTLTGALNAKITAAEARAERLRTSLATLADRAEAGGVLTENEAGEYRKLTGGTS